MAGISSIVLLLNDKKPSFDWLQYLGWSIAFIYCYYSTSPIWFNPKTKHRLEGELTVIKAVITTEEVMSQPRYPYEIGAKFDQPFMRAVKAKGLPVKGTIILEPDFSYDWLIEHDPLNRQTKIECVKWV